MFKFIETHMKKKRVQARASQPKELVYISREQIQQKLSQYAPAVDIKRANFTGPDLNHQ